MKHYGDITKLSGYELPVVDFIFGGSPCQDLSVAGRRAGMKHSDLGDEETTRSGLFMDQVRLVKEMRERERASGRPAELIRPRYFGWENVPGALSSPGKDHKGEDFAAVLEEVIKIAEPGAVLSLPVPDGGWPNAGCIYSESGTWSLAWRVHDSQFWGVPQRRRRLALCADLNGLSAPAILFDYEYGREAAGTEPDKAQPDPRTQPRSEVHPVGESLPGNPGEGGAPGQGTPAGAESGADSAIPIEGNGARPSHYGNGYGNAGEPSFTLNTIEQHGVCAPASGVVCKGNGDAFLMNEKHTSLSCGGGMPGQSYACAMVEDTRAAGFSFGQSAKARSLGYEEEVSPTLRGGEGGNQKPHCLVTHSISFQERAGKPGGGKGILIQDEHTGALSTLNIQHVFSIQGNAIDRDTKQNGCGVCEDVAHTLDSVDRHGVAITEEI